MSPRLFLVFEPLGDYVEWLSHCYTKICDSTIEFNDRAGCYTILHELTQFVSQSGDPQFKSRPPFGMWFTRRSVTSLGPPAVALGRPRGQSPHFAGGFVLIEKLHAMQCAAQELLGQFARSIQRITMALWELTCGRRLIFSMRSIQRIRSSPTLGCSGADTQMKLDTSSIDFDRTTFIWSKSALDVAAKLGVDNDRMIGRLQGINHSNLFVFPDGSIQFEGSEALEAFELTAGNRLREHAVQSQRLTLRRSSLTPLGGSWYAGLEPFAEKRRYALWLWADFAMKNDGSHLVIDTGSNWSVNAYPQCPIDNLLITFVLSRKFSKSTRTEFASLLARWLVETQTIGGSVAPIDHDVAFYDRVSQMRVNAVDSDQEAFNWLILSLIEFCATNLVLRVFFTENADAYISIKNEYGLAGLSPTLIKINR